MCGQWNVTKSLIFLPFLNLERPLKETFVIEKEKKWIFKTRIKKKRTKIKRRVEYMQRGIPKSIAASTHPSQPSYCRAQATLRSQTQPHWTNRLSSRKERGIWKQTAAIRAACEINASNKATQTNYSSPLPSSALSNTEKQLGFPLQESTALMFFQIINISFHSLLPPEIWIINLCGMNIKPPCVS